MEEDGLDEPQEGAPAWMATFADLMSLLVCFFVLLLSFSEMDVVKYRTIAGSLKEAFGVQSKIDAQSIPKGTSVIAQEFSPGTPQPIAQPIITQRTSNDSQHSLQTGTPESGEGTGAGLEDLNSAQRYELLREMLSADGEEETLRNLLRDGIEEGKVEIESSMNQITIRIREQGSFPSGKAVLNDEFLPLVGTLRLALKEIGGTISVEGHTDNVPIVSPAFDSNWDLSAARALSVAKELMRGETLNASRFMVVGHAETRPYRPNTSPENRAANRRVEIVIRSGVGEEEGLEMPSRSLAELQD